MVQLEQGAPQQLVGGQDRLLAPALVGDGLHRLGLHGGTVPSRLSGRHPLTDLRDVLGAGAPEPAGAVDEDGKG